MCYKCGYAAGNDDHGKGHAAVDIEGQAVTNKTFDAVRRAFQNAKLANDNNRRNLRINRSSDAE